MIDTNSKQLNLKWVSDAIGKEYKNWCNNDIILLNAQTGTGKSYFIKNQLMQYALEEHKQILYICNRINLKRQVKIDLAKMQGIDISDWDIEKIDKLEQIGNITIVSYQKIQHHILNMKYGIQTKDDTDYFNFDYVVLDEIHYILADSTFNNKTIFFFEDFLKKYKNAVMIYMSATMDNIKDLILKLYKDKNNRIYEYTTGTDYSYISAFYFKDMQDIINTINNDISGEKWIVFINNISNAVELLDKINDSIFICSENNKHYGKVNKEELENIINTEKFNAKCLICTKALDNGININDELVTNVVIMSLDKIDFIQALGRKRVNINDAQQVNLYLNPRYKKTFQCLLNMNIEPKYNVVKLFLEENNKFKRQYDVNLQEFANISTLFYKGEDFILNMMGYEMLLKQKEFAEYMINLFKISKEAYLIEQLDWINAEYNPANYIENVIAAEEVETLEEYLESIVGQRLYDEEQQKISDLIIKELITIDTKVDYRTKKLKPSTLENIIREQLNLSFAVSKPKREDKIVDGNRIRKRYIIITKL